MIKIGDIVARDVSCLDDDRAYHECVLPLFRHGYFLVIDMQTSLCLNGKLITVYLVMNSFGITSWIDKQSLLVVVELENA